MFAQSPVYKHGGPGSDTVSPGEPAEPGSAVTRTLRPDKAVKETGRVDFVREAHIKAPATDNGQSVVSADQKRRRRGRRGWWGGQDLLESFSFKQREALYYL